MTLAAAVEKYKAGEKEGAMAPEVANGLVEALREYVRLVLDSQLSDVYKHFTEQKEEDALKTGEESGTIKGLKSNLLPGALGLRRRL